MYSFQVWPPDDATCISYKLGHLVVVVISDSITYKFVHQVAPFASVISISDDDDDDDDDDDADDDEVVVSVSHSGSFVRANYGPLTS